MLRTVLAVVTDVRVAARTGDLASSATLTQASSTRRHQTSRIALLLAGLFLSLYVLTMGGHLDSPDEELMFQVTRSLVERGSMNIGSAVSPEHLGMAGADGQTYVPYGPVSSVLSVPFFYVGQGLEQLLPAGYAEVALRFGVGLRDPVVSAAAGAVFFFLALELGYDTLVSVLLTLAFGIATLIWPYSKYSWSEPVTCLCLLVSVLAALRTVGSNSVWWSTLSGIALGLAVGTKITTAIVAPLLLVYIAGAGHGSLLVRLRRSLPFIVVMLVPVVGLAFFNISRFGDPLTTGYYVTGLTQTLNPIGIAGLLASPGKSVFLYVPVALLGVIGLGVLARRRAWDAGLFLALVLSHLLVYGPLVIWSGDAAWGPRYLVPVMPYLVLPVGALLAWSCGLWRRLAWGAFLVLAAAGVIVNLGGVLVDQRVSFGRLLAQADMNLARMNDLRWDPLLSPVLIHWAEFSGRLTSVAESRSAGANLVSGTYGRELGDLANVSAMPSSSLFPRWTSGSAVFDLRNDRQPVTLTLDYFDSRPGSLGPSMLEVVVDGTPLPDAAVTRRDTGPIVGKDRQAKVLTAVLDPAVVDQDVATVELRSKTWQPARESPSTPDFRDLGIEIWDVQFTSNGVQLPMREELLSPMPVSDARPWSYELETWFYTQPHLADVWLWYLYLSGLPRWLLLLGLIPACGVVLASFELWRAVREHSSPAGTPPRPAAEAA